MSKENRDKPSVHSLQNVESNQQSTDIATSIIRAQIPAVSHASSSNSSCLTLQLPQSFANSDEWMGALRSEVANQVKEDLRNNGLVGMVSTEQFWKARANWTAELLLCQRHSDQRISSLTSEFKTKMDAKEALLAALYSEIEKITSQVENEKSCHHKTQQKFDDAVKEMNDVTKEKNKILKESNHFECLIDRLTLSFKNMLDGNDDKIVEKSSQGKSRSRRVIIQDLKDCLKKISVLLADLKMINSKLEELSLANQKEIASLEESMAKLKVDNDDISSKLADAEEQLAFQRQTITSFGDTTATLEKERDSLRERSNAVNEELESLKKSFSLSLEERVNKVVEELSGKPSSEEVLQELSECREKMKHLQAEISDIKQLSEADQQEILRLKEINFELEDAKEKLQTSREQSTTSNWAIKADLGSVSKELASLQERYTAMEAQLAGKEENLALSAACNLELQQTVEDLKRQLQKEIYLKEKALREADERSQELSASNAMIGENSKKIFELENQASNLNQTVVRLRNRLATYSQLSKDTNPKPIMGAEPDRYELMSNINKLAIELDSAKTRLEKGNRDLESCQKELGIAKHYSKTWKNEKTELVKSLNDAQQLSKFKDREFNSMKAKLDKKLECLQKEATDLFYQVEAQLKSKESVLTEIAHLNVRNVDARPKLSARKPPVSAHLNRTIPQKRSSSDTNSPVSVLSVKQTRFSPGSKKQTPKKRCNKM